MTDDDYSRPDVEPMPAADGYHAEYDRELLAATARRHSQQLPPWASIALAGAVNELTDPVTLPVLVDFPEAATRDLVAVIGAVRHRLVQATQSAAGTTSAMTWARAARQLGTALTELNPPPARDSGAAR